MSVDVTKCFTCGATRDAREVAADHDDLRCAACRLASARAELVEARLEVTRMLDSQRDMGSLEDVLAAIHVRYPDDPYAQYLTDRLEYGIVQRAASQLTELHSRHERATERIRTGLGTSATLRWERFSVTDARAVLAILEGGTITSASTRRASPDQARAEGFASGFDAALTAAVAVLEQSYDAGNETNATDALWHAIGAVRALRERP